MGGILHSAPPSCNVGGILHSVPPSCIVGVILHPAPPSSGASGRGAGAAELPAGRVSPPRGGAAADATAGGVAGGIPLGARVVALATREPGRSIIE